MNAIASATLTTGKIIAIGVALSIHVVLACLDFLFTALGCEPHDDLDW